MEKNNKIRKKNSEKNKVIKQKQKRSFTVTKI